MAWRIVGGGLLAVRPCSRWSELSAAGQQRIVVATRDRGDYLAAATPASCWSPPDRTSSAFQRRRLRGAVRRQPGPDLSGRRDRHRLNPVGDRDANRTLHMIAVVRLRYCQRTPTYAQRRITEGKTKPEIIRCLKRYIAREAFHALCADLADLTSQRPARPTIATTITCGAGPICPVSRNRDRLARSEWGVPVLMV
jgi:hypothetical protein